MTLEQLQGVHHAVPFPPFTLHLADGRHIRVPHRDFLSRSKSGRTIIVQHEDETFSILDMLLITEIEVHNGQRRAKRHET